ncbi:25564_t:CDS:2 [Dentiscutata erythropus]|uniref:25564_t:CDS:1 n=1 Tax=Dentiscutata erythropus TaxID=1348616 RepID=A0A9N8VNT2_9GLOM|nr:25564_t:CDS:2 [Dentiscutata erythropus]
MEQGANCTADDQCQTKICRIADPDGHTSQTSDTRENGVSCLADAACKSDLCIAHCTIEAAGFATTLRNNYLLYRLNGIISLPR